MAKATREELVKALKLARMAMGSLMLDSGSQMARNDLKEIEAILKRA